MGLTGEEDHFSRQVVAVVTNEEGGAGGANIYDSSKVALFVRAIAQTAIVHLLDNTTTRMHF